MSLCIFCHLSLGSILQITTDELQPQDEKDLSAGAKKFNILAQTRVNLKTLIFRLIFTDGINSSADAAERLGPLQTDPTDMSGEERHLEHSNTDMHNGHTLNQGDMSQSEAA